jgi:hypothetical protein
MLAKEKRRVGWSIGAGAVVAGSFAGYYYLQAFNANRRLRILVAECEMKAAPAAPDVPPGYKLDPAPVVPPKDLPPGFTEEPIKPLTDADFDAICDPKDLVLDDIHGLSGFQAKIADTAREADNDRADGRSSALIAFLIFCLPLVWYLVLDRIRELSAAIAGRDRSP